MPRYALTIAYDGTDFCGWQKQEPPLAPADAQSAYGEETPQMPSVREGRAALRTVQGVLERAVREVVREPIELVGASRTDSGVHARGQVAAFTCEPRDEELTPGPPVVAPEIAGPETGLPPKPRGTGWPLSRGTDRLLAALNSRLPDDVLLTSARVVPHDFDPIKGALRKRYTYALHVSPNRPLFDRRVVHWVQRTVDVSAMQHAAALLIGEHDFAAFAATGHGRLTTVRRIFACSVEQSVERVVISVEGNGFLWNMVRIIAGTLLDVGTGTRPPECVRTAIETKDRRALGPTLPPTGLCLEWVDYGP